MPIPFFMHVIQEGPPPWITNNASTIVYSTLAITALVLLKLYTSGRSNTSERVLHGKVVIMTGVTTGVGAQAAEELAKRGAQLVLLTQAPRTDPFLADYMQDLRSRTENDLIYAEQVDLSSLHSIRQFATKWIDNAPPRRLDMIVLCAATLTPPGSNRRETEEGLEETWMVNYLANFHLLGILSPALRAQPFDRDVRVIITSCGSYITSPSLKEALSPSNWSPSKAYSRSKLAMNVFGQAYQKHLESYKRPDGIPMNARVIFADPGLCRTPGMRRWLTRGSLLGLAAYTLFYAVPWFLLKSPYMGAQTIVFAAMEPALGRGRGGRLIKECHEVDFARTEVKDEDVAKKLWEESDALIEKTEKATAKKRAVAKADEDKREQKRQDDEKKAEIDGLVQAIKKGKAAGQDPDPGKGKSKGKSKKKSK